MTNTIRISKLQRFNLAFDKRIIFVYDRKTMKFRKYCSFLAKKNILFVVIGFYFIFLAKQAFSWLDCPFGKINDPYPGSCFRYLDTNNNKICDRSEPAPTIQSVNKIASQQGNQQTSQPGNSLYFWTIFLTLSFYFVHWYLVFKTSLYKKFKWLNQLIFRFFWNLVLVASFFPVGISGLLIILGKGSPSLSFWHNFFGLIFVVAGFFHFWGRIGYFKNLKNIFR